MAEIFLSYSRYDSLFVDKLIDKLKNSGHHVWVDRNSIRGGEKWRKQIVEAINTSDIFLLVLSPRSVKSDNVRKELDLAEEAKIPVIPIELKKTKISTEMGYQLAGLQKISFSSFNKGCDQLLSAIRTYQVPLDETNQLSRTSFWLRAMSRKNQIIAAVCFLIVSIILGFVFRPDIKCSSSSYQSDITNCLLCTCQRAFDHNTRTRWASKWRDDEWIILDLGEPKSFDTVVLNWEAAFGKAYTIDVSNDRISWITVYTQSDGSGGIETITFPLTTARYVRMQGISRGTTYDTPDSHPYGYSLWEFQIYEAARSR